MMPPTIRVSLLIAIAVAATPAPAAQDDLRAEAAKYLQANGFAAADLARLEAGKAVARATLSAGDTEILAAGAVKIHATRDQVASYYAQMISYVDGQVTLAFGRFSTPPVENDVQGLSFDTAEIEALKSCRVGDCDIRLGGASLTGLRAAIDWTAPDYASAVNRYLRVAAVRYLADYQTRGDAALVTYNDRAQPVSLAKQWGDLLTNSAMLKHSRPELHDYLARYPAGTLAGSKSVFYWSKEYFGLKPIVSLVHGIVYEPPGRTDRIFVAQKQLYASHYYDASLALGTIVGGVENGAAVSYLLYANRSRGDLLKGGFGGVRRAAARRQAEGAAEETLTTIKNVLEQQR